MFEEYTEENLQEIAEEMGEELGVDTRQGSIYMDAAMGHIIRTAKFYSDLSDLFDMMNIHTCTGEILDAKCAEFGIERKQATHAHYNFAVNFSGDMEELVGLRFACEEIYFVVVIVDDEYYMMSEEPGAAYNNILPQAMDEIDYVDGLDEIRLLDLAIAGTDEETDEALRERLQSKITDQPGGGNKAQFKYWCESFKGVGRAVIIPLARGENTVEAIIINENGTAPEETLIREIQEYIDPDSEGLGEGVASIGCKFYAVACEEISINISCNVVLQADYTQEIAESQIRQSLTNYLKSVSMSDDTEKEVKYMKVAALIMDCTAVKDVSNLFLNGGTENIVIPANSVSVLGEVEV